LNILRRTSTFLCFVGMSSILGLMFLTTFDVIGRSFLGRPIPGTFELSEYMLCLVLVLGLAYTEREKGHIRVEVLRKRIKSGRRVLELITGLIGLCVVSVLVVYGWKEAVAERGVSDMLRIPRYPFKFLLCLGSFMFGLELISGLLEVKREGPP